MSTFLGLLFVRINQEQKLMQQMEFLYIVNEWLVCALGQGGCSLWLIKSLRGAIVAHTATRVLICACSVTYK